MWSRLVTAAGAASRLQCSSQKEACMRALHQFHLSRSSFCASSLPPSSDNLPKNNDDAETETETRREAAMDLFHQYSKQHPKSNGEWSLDLNDVRALLTDVGEGEKDDRALRKLFDVADEDHNGLIDAHEFMEHSDYILGGNPARIILVIGGPGSGKGLLSQQLQDACHVVHLSSGDMLRDEVARGSSLGRQVKDIMARGELVSSAIMVALMKRRMRDHPGKRVLLDGFTRSLENAHDLVTLCGKPEMALQLVCDDTVLLERIIHRGAQAAAAAAAAADDSQNTAADAASSGGQQRREDDNFQTALQRLRTFHKYHPQTMEWLREQRVPIVNLDCSGPPESVWEQLQAIGRLMRPAVKLPSTTTTTTGAVHHSVLSPEEEEDEQPAGMLLRPTGIK